MSSDRTRIINLIGLLTVALGSCGLLTGAIGIVTLPAPSPNSDGFIRSGALLYYTLLCVFSFWITGVGVWLMSVYGGWNPLGFSYSQRRVLSFAGYSFALSIPAGIAVSFIRMDWSAGALIAFVLLSLGTVVVGAASLWRGGTVVRRWMG